MGNATAKEAKSAPVVDGALPSASSVVPKLVTKGAQKIYMTQSVKGWGGQTYTFSSEDGTRLFDMKGKKGVTTLEITVTDPSGTVLAVGKYTDRPTTASFDICKPDDKIVGSCKIEKGWGSATCSYSVGDSVVYTAKKFKSMAFFMAMTQNDKTVTKVCQPGMNNLKYTMEVGGGVGIVELALITAFAAHAGTSGQGGAAGGLVGAGVI